MKKSILNIIKEFIPFTYDVQQVAYYPTDNLRDYDMDVEATIYDVRLNEAPYKYRVILLHAPQLVVPPDVETTFEGEIDQLVIGYIMPGGTILSVASKHTPRARFSTPNGDYFLGLLQT